MSVLQYDTANGNPNAVLPPGGDDAVYISGRYANYMILKQDRPGAIILPITVTLPYIAALRGFRQIAFDFESGALDPSQALECVTTAHEAGIPCPVCYGSLDTWDGTGGLWDMLSTLIAGVQFQAWLAQPDTVQIVPARYAAKQFLFGVEFDTSLVANPVLFYNLPLSPPKPPGDTEMVAPYETSDRRTGFVVETAGGEILHIEQQNPPGAGNSDFWRNADGSPDWLTLGTPGGAKS